MQKHPPDEGSKHPAKNRTGSLFIWMSENTLRATKNDAMSHMIVQSKKLGTKYLNYTESNLIITTITALYHRNTLILECTDKIGKE